MEHFEVDCIAACQWPPQHDHITHVGHRADRWRLTRESVITRIESRSDAFYVRDPSSGTLQPLQVIRQAGKPAYLQVKPSSRSTDPLLDLPPCPKSCRLVP